MISLTCISDTHGLHNKMKHSVGTGNILVHAGDLTNIGKRSDVESIIAFFHRQLDNFDDVVFIAGNHDLSFDPCFGETNKGRFVRYYANNQDIVTHELEKPDWLIDILGSMDKRIHYLENNSEIIQGKLFYGSPMTPDFFREYWAFNAARGHEIRNYWSVIPKNVDVLITHGPAKGILDLLENGVDNVGCEELEYTINYELENLKLHVFGHIHNPHGKYTNDRGTTFVNASTCTEEYSPINMPMQVHL